jgi:sugar phosphate isomerase/epimerase
MKSSRRDFLVLTGAGILGTSLSGISSIASPVITDMSKFTFDLGVASYSLRKFSLDDALKMTKRLAISRISLKDFHLPMDASDELIASTVAKCEAAGIKAYSGGVIYMKNKDEVDNAFEYAKKAKMSMIIGVPEHELLSYVEKKVQDYNISLAIHNHGPGDNKYPSAESAYVLIKNMDPRMGLCIDIGHTKRINRDPEQDYLDFSDRVLDFHIKDVTSDDAKGTCCVMGRGVINVPSFLKALVKKKFAGTLSLEYEAEENDPLAGMAETFGYVRGILSMMKTK